MPAASSEKTSSTTKKADIGDDIAKIKADIAALANTLGAFGKDRLGTISDVDFKSSDETLQTANYALKELRREIASIEHSATRKVADNPVQALLVAAGLVPALFTIGGGALVLGLGL